MNYIKRKVFLTKDLVPYDSNNDGHYDSLTISATTKSILIPLITSYDDMGIFEVDDEEIIDIIDIGSIFDDGIDGKDITQPPDPTDPNSSDWGSGTGQGSGGAGQPYDYEYCGDVSAPNYQSIQNIGSYFGVVGTDTQIIAGLTAMNITLVVNNSLCSDAGGPADSGDAATQGGYFLDSPYNLWTTETVPGNSGNSYCHSGAGKCRDHLAARDGGYYCKCGCETETSSNKNWTTSSWNSYKSTAYSKGAIFCLSQGKQIIPNALSSHPGLQGNPTNYPVDGIGWAGVKLKTVEDDKCCPNWVDYRSFFNNYNEEYGTNLSVVTQGWCPNSPASARNNNHCCGAYNTPGNLITAYNYESQFFCITQ